MTLQNKPLDNTKTLLAFLLIFVFAVNKSYGNSIVVLNNNEANAGSLRQAILDANSGDTISFNAITNGIDIALDSQIVIAKDLVIIGNDTTNTIISGNNLTRIFWIEDYNVKIIGIKIKNGHAEGLTVDDNRGGGIYSLGRITIENCLITHNLAFVNGGGIYCEGTSVITKTDFIENICYVAGGACYFDGDTSIFDYCNIIDNRSNIGPDSLISNGGGLYLSTGKFGSIKDCYVSGNITEGMKSSGGGIYIEVLDFIEIINVTMINNYAGQNGGGIYVETPDTCRMMNCTIVGNYAEDDGGGIDTEGNTFTVANTLISGNSVGNLGGGVNSEADKLSFYNCTIAGNYAANGGGGIYNDRDTMWFQNTIIAKNTCDFSQVDFFNYQGDIVDFGNNLIGDTTGTRGQFTMSTLLGNSLSPLDPVFRENVDVSSLPNATGDLGIAYLYKSSPAYNAGGVDTTGLMLGLYDLDGTPRIKDGNIDIGAFEFDPNSVPTIGQWGLIMLALSILIFGIIGVKGLNRKRKLENSNYFID